MFIAYYTFKPTHRERHYLVNPRGRKYETTFSRDPAQAARYKTDAEARAAINKILDRGDRGRADGYCFTGYAESLEGLAND